MIVPLITFIECFLNYIHFFRTLLPALSPLHSLTNKKTLYIIVFINKKIIYSKFRTLSSNQSIIKK